AGRSAAVALEWRENATADRVVERQQHEERSVRTVVLQIGVAPHRTAELKFEIIRRIAVDRCTQLKVIVLPKPPIRIPTHILGDHFADAHSRLFGEAVEVAELRCLLGDEVSELAGRGGEKWNLAEVDAVIERRRFERAAEARAIAHFWNEQRSGRIVNRHLRD